MAVWNAAETVVDAVASIRGQTWPDWQLLLIDDASSDGTAEILEKLASQDDRITLIRNQQNQGLAACLNIGWRHSSAKLIARMDADDLALPTRLEEQVQFLESHPDIAVLGTGAELRDESGQSLGLAFRPEFYDELSRNIYRANPFFHPSVMMRREYLEKLGGYNPRLRRAQDYDLWLRGYRLFKFHNLQRALVSYRVRRKSSFRAIFSGAFVLTSAAYREGKLLRQGWNALPFLLLGLVTKAGLYTPATFRGKYRYSGREPITSSSVKGQV